MNVLDGTNVTQITYPTGLGATVTVAATSYPWSRTDPTYPFTPSGATGTGPTSVTMTQGQVITLSYASGTITNVGPDIYDPTGAFLTPDNTYPGHYVIGSSIPAAGCLIGAFANASGWVISPPFYIGTNLTIGPAPLGTTQLLLGLNTNTYDPITNTGSWVMNIVPPTYYISKYGSWERGAYSNEASFSMNAGSMELNAYIPESVVYPGTTTSLMQVVNQGALNGAKVIIQSLYWPLGSLPSSGFSMGTMQLMIGQIGNVKTTGRSKVVCEVFDLTYILNRPFPPHLIQSVCRHTFCDSGCTLQINNVRSTPYALDASSTTLYLNFIGTARTNGTPYIHGNLIVISNVVYMCTTEGTSAGSLPAYTTTRGAVTTDGTASFTSLGSLVAGTSAANQSFPQGYVLGMTGQNTGIKATIKMQAVASGLFQLQLIKPLPFAVAAGDTFRLFSGCDKTLGTCTIIYANQIHYGGQPYVPNPEIAS
jgi:hypothetical protein